jgi:hypothetical protein
MSHPGHSVQDEHTGHKRIFGEIYFHLHRFSLQNVLICILRPSFIDLPVFYIDFRTSIVHSSFPTSLTPSFSMPSYIRLLAIVHIDPVTIITPSWALQIKSSFSLYHPRPISLNQQEHVFEKAKRTIAPFQRMLFNFCLRNWPLHPITWSE